MNDSEVINHYLTADEAVQLLGCSKRTLRRYVSQGLVGKRGKGKGTRYSASSVLMLSKGESMGKLDLILQQLKVLTVTQQELITRVTLLESIFMPRGGNVDLDPCMVESIRSAIRESYKSTLTYEVCRDWSDDLLRLSDKSCRSIGYGNLNRFVDHLICNASGLHEVLKSPSRRIVLDKLKWFKIRLKSYASLETSEV